MEPITIKYRNSNGKFDPTAPDSTQRLRDTNALIELLTSEPSRYPEMIEIRGDFDIDVIREELGHDFFGEDAIIFSRDYGDEGPWCSIYPSMDALMTPRDDDMCPNDHPATSLYFSHLCNFEGPLDADRLFSVDEFMFVNHIEFEGCEHLDININYPTVEFWEPDDYHYPFMNSKINPPIDKWKVDERVHNLSAWFANSEFNQPLNNWKLTKLGDIGSIFFRSKYNHPLDKWYTKPITIYAEFAFAESECHQDLSMWRINPDSKCDGMFYNSKYTIEEVSQWPWVKNLNQPIEDLFRITEEAEEHYRWLLDVIEDY